MSKSKEIKKNLKKIQPNSKFINYKLISCNRSIDSDLFEWMKRGYKEMASINLSYAEEAVTAEFYDELEYERWLCGVW